MSGTAAHERAPAAVPARTWQLEAADAIDRTDDFGGPIITCRSASGALLYWQPLQRLANSWDALDLFGHLAKKSSVSDADIGGLIRLLDGLFDFATAYPRGVPAFDAVERVAEIKRRRGGDAA